MNTLIKNTALAAAVFVSSVSYAAAQSGPVDGKGQAGGTAHRLAEPGTVARGDYDARGETVVMSPDSYRSAELRRGSDYGYETRSVSEPRGYGSETQMREEPSAEVSGPQDRR